MARRLFRRSSRFAWVLALGSTPALADNLGQEFHVVSPNCRVLDTRIGGTPLQSGVPFAFSFVQAASPGQCFIPSTATAVSATVTLVTPTQTGFVTLYPSYLPSPPPTSTINASAGTAAIANGAIVQLCGQGCDGNVTAIYGTVSPGTAHLLVDVTGYYAYRSTLFVSLTSFDKNAGAVTVQGTDFQSPAAPFEFSWGDGTTSSGSFPKSHLYANKTRPYTITITARYRPGQGIAAFTGVTQDSVFLYVDFTR